ncbi:MAG: type II toxin-antitoxin system RelB/DinJ family antitoxin [Defluviitaleaceae bacterium]|nr:type II toxin-antitoxin system RelB/DinJ family antitoxin [Defluviitaleaceae bacterium]
MDNTLKMQAQDILESLGLDMTTAFDMFLKHIVSKQPLHFIETSAKDEDERERAFQARLATRGSMKGEIWMAEDFNDPMNPPKENTP